MRRLKVLVADDHELMLAAVRLALAEANDEFEIVAETTRGQQVLPLAARTQPDLVLLDLRMPGMDGLTCLELLRQRHPKIKTVVLSGVDEPNVIRSAFGRGAVAYIPPVARGACRRGARRALSPEAAPVRTTPGPRGGSHRR